MSQEVPSSPSQTKLAARWIDPTNNLSEKQRSFYENKEFLDLTLIAGEDSVRIEAHKIVVSTSSGYLLTAIRSAGGLSEIILPQIDGITMKMIVDFMYTASIEINLDTARTILRAAQLLQIKSLIDACCDFLIDHLDVTNCLGIALFAEQYSFTNLFEKAFAFAYKNFGKVSMEKEFLQLGEEDIMRFLSTDVFVPISVENVCQSLVPWIEYDRVNREKLINEILSKISFTLLKGRFFTEKGNSPTSSIEFYKSFCTWLRAYFAPKSPSNFLVLVFGNNTNGDLKIQIYNRRLNSWSLERVPPIPKTKNAYRIVGMNNKLFIVGGTSEDANSVVCLDLETKEWSNLPPMNHKRLYSGAAELNEDLYAIGGRFGGAYIRDVERYSFATGQWQDVKPMIKATQYLIPTAALDGRLYVAVDSFRPMQCYDPVKDQWHETAPKKGHVQWFCIAAVGAYMYNVGGKVSEGRKIVKVERYDPATDSWTYVAPIQVPVSNVRCTTLNNRLVVCGAGTGDLYVDTVQEYNPETDEWKVLAPFVSDECYSSHCSLFSM